MKHFLEEFKRQRKLHSTTPTVGKYRLLQNKQLMSHLHSNYVARGGE